MLSGYQSNSRMAFMNSEKLEQARKYETEYLKNADESDRPMLHATGTVGWINDPNGFSMYRGEYHLFYQYHPYTTFWGPMHWGHIKTKDFIKWDRLPVAIAPDTDYDEKGCFSGSALELEDGRQLLMYTGVHFDEHQQQCIAFGDGVNYEKYKGNPVIPTDAIPEGHHLIDFRDPKIYQKDNRFYMVAGSRTEDGSGSVVLYESENLKNWNYLGILDRSDNLLGKMWECPDYFELDEKQVIITSPQDMIPLDAKWHSGNQTLVLIGAGDGKANFRRQSAEPIDFGMDFYAPQTLLSKDGRRIMIAWMQSWDTCNVGHENRDWFGQMSLPRELSIVNGKLYQSPVRELEQYYTDSVEKCALNLKNEKSESFDLGLVYDMTLNIRPKNEMLRFALHIGEQGPYKTTIIYDAITQSITVDRSLNAIRREIPTHRSFRVEPLTNQNGARYLKLRIIKDINSMELFVNDGAQTCSMMLAEPDGKLTVSMEVVGAVECDLISHNIQVN